MTNIHESAEQGNAQRENPLLSAALARAAEGWAVHPLWGIVTRGGVRQCECPLGARCEKPGKKPRLEGWKEKATRNAQQIRAWWKLYPHANIGGHTGKKSGRNVLDEDPQKGGTFSRELLETEHGALPDTQQTITGGGGTHWHFAYDGPLTNSVSSLGPGLDIRSDGGNLVLPGSLHISGRVYEYEATHGPDDLALAPMPAWLRAKLIAQSNGHHKVHVEGEPIENGQRNDTLFRLACSMRARGCSRLTILSALRAENETRCKPPLADKEVEKIAASCSKYEPGASNGASPSFQMGDDEDDEQETEAEENARMMKEERPIDDPYPCPDHLFRGPFRRVAEETGKKTWEVWAATCVALGAKAHRDIAYRYHRMLYAMMYALIIKGTGMGKGLSTDLCRGLMPNWYVIRDAVQSGPALAPLLADIVRDKKGKVESCTSHPALLLIEEFTVLLKNAGIQHSTLIDSLNGLFHRTWPWNISRTDRPNGGGGDVVIEKPTLSILATTTEALFKEYVSPQMIRSGFLNRYLVLPGDSTPWKFYDPEGAGKIIEQNLGILDYIPIRKVGDGKTVWQAYETSAFERMRSWGEQTFETVMQSSDLEAESVKRLHVYAHVICLLYAWGEGRDLVNIDDVECSIAVIETSKRFLQALITEDREPEVPMFKAYEMNLEQRILAKVTEAAAQGIRRRAVVRSLQRHATTPDLYAFITKMVQVGTIREVAEPTAGANKPVHKLYLPEHNPKREKRPENER